MIRWAARRPAAVWAFAGAILLAGAVSFTRLPLATRTVIELPQLQVSGSWRGASAELVEMYLTAPIEAAIQGVRGVKRINSRSNEGRSQLTVELESDADVRMTRLAILERLEMLREEFPPGSTPPSVENYVPQELDEEPLLFYTISGPYTPGSLERIANEQIVPRLGSVPGVAGVVAQGGAELGVSVSYNPQRLRQLGLSPSDLVVAIRDARMVEALGNQRAGSTERRVVLRDQPGALADLARLPIRGAGGLIYRLGEIATVRQEEDARGFFFRVDGRPAVSLSISRLPGADAIKTARRVRETLADIEAGLPVGIRLDVVDDGSKELARQLADLARRGALAFFLVALVLAVALRNAKSIVLVLGSAAVAIAGTALGLYLLDIPANLLTLAGLGMGIGILVQNGLIVVERLRRAPDTVDGRAEAGRRILPALLGATLTTAVVLLPFLYLQGNARAAFMPFAAAFTLALGCSVISAVVMIPAVAAGHGAGAARTRWPRLDRLYRRVVIRVLRWRWATIVLTLGTLAVLGWGFVTKVPRVDWGRWGQRRTSLSVYLGFPRGSDPASADQSIREFEALAVGAPGVERVVTRGGSQFGGAQMQVWFRREDAFTGRPQQLQETLTQRAVFVGGVSVSVQGDGPGFSTGFGGGGSVSFRIKILGYSFSGVERLALDLKERLERVSRVRDVDINAAGFFSRERAYEVTLVPDRPALARYGVTATDLAAAVAREVSGAAGRQLIEIDGEEYPVTLKTAGAAERTLAELRAAMVPNARNAPVQVGDLARVGERETLANIRREDQQYVRILSYGFRGPTKLAQRTHDAFMASVSVPAGYSVADVEYIFGSDESEQGLWLVFAMGVVLVLLVVAMVFDSVWAAAMVFVSLPLALAGVAAAFWVADAAFTREAAVGVILVIGLAVNQSILLVDAVLERRRTTGDGRHPLSAAQLVAACRDRSGMILLVTFTTLASLLPLAIGTSSDSLFGAIALATSGGVVAGTIGALLVMPAVLSAGAARAAGAGYSNGS
ncbi:MAG: efflux RND transporter permease subunit [Gemmatimonadetes bacterium]|nr:MAG: efflux RND transporter permease subunit [Gemmatimonadota bacterium]